MKVLLVGEQNPYGGGQEFAMYPSPEGCSGHRLCVLILGMRRGHYLDHFDRANLCDGPWDQRRAEERAHELCMTHERLILLGAKVARAFCLAAGPFLRTAISDVEGRHPRRNILTLPHPSGRCRTWNVPGSIKRARDMVGDFAPEVAHLLGQVGGDE